MRGKHFYIATDSIANLSGHNYKTEENFKERIVALTNNNMHVLKDLYEIVNGTPTTSDGRYKERIYLCSKKKALMSCKTTLEFDRKFATFRDEFYERWDRCGYCS